MELIGYDINLFHTKLSKPIISLTFSTVFRATKHQPDKLNNPQTRKRKKERKNPSNKWKFKHQNASETEGNSGKIVRKKHQELSNCLKMQI